MGITIRTKSEQVYNSLNNLKFNDETRLPNDRSVHRIINSINKRGDFLDVSRQRNELILRKKNSFKFNVYR